METSHDSAVSFSLSLAPLQAGQVFASLSSQRAAAAPHLNGGGGSSLVQSVAADARLSFDTVSLLLAAFLQYIRPY